MCACATGFIVQEDQCVDIRRRFKVNYGKLLGRFENAYQNGFKANVIKLELVLNQAHVGIQGEVITVNVYLVIKDLCVWISTIVPTKQFAGSGLLASTQTGASKTLTKVF